MPSPVAVEQQRPHSLHHHHHQAAGPRKSLDGAAYSSSHQNGSSANGALASTAALHEILANPLKFDKSVMNPAHIKYRPINEPHDEPAASSSKGVSNGKDVQTTNGSGASRPVRVEADEADDDEELPRPPKRKLLFDGKIPLAWPSGTKNVGAGLHNRGNTCYMNSVMQSLVHTPPLLHLLLSYEASLLKGKAGGELRGGFDPVRAMQSFARRAAAGGQTSPIELIKNLKAIARTFSHGRQEDAHEWLRLLLESMHQSCIVQLSQKAKVSSPLRETTFIHRIFGGKLRSRVTCLSCQHNSDTFETMLDLSLDIRKSGNLKEALDLFTEKDQLRGSERYKCESCKRLSNAVKYYRIAECPQVLTVHLKRFTFTGSKNNKPFAFPTQFRMGRSWLCSNSEGERDTADQHVEEPTYSLYALVHHHGSGPHSGHYVAEVKGKDGRWYTMNDDMVSPTSQPGMASRSAYILFYVRNAGQSLEKIIKGGGSAAPALIERQASSSNGVKGTASPATTNGKQSSQSSSTQFSIKHNAGGSSSSPTSSSSRFSSSNGPQLSSNRSVLSPINATVFHSNHANGKRKAVDEDDEQEDLGEGVNVVNGADETITSSTDAEEGNADHSALQERSTNGSPPPQSRKAKRRLLKQLERENQDASSVRSPHASPSKKQKTHDRASHSFSSDDAGAPAASPPPPATKSPSSSSFSASSTKFGSQLMSGLAARMKGKGRASR